MSDISYRWDSIIENAYDQYLLQQELAFITTAIGNVATEFRVLEVGCGTGRITAPLISRGLKIVGLDYNYVPLMILAQKYPPTELTNGDGQNLPFESASFNCVIAIQSLLNFDPYLFLAESWRVLKHDGLLIYQFLNQHSYKWLLKRLVNDLQWVNSTSYLKPQVILDATMRNGFQIQSLRGYSWPPTLRSSNSFLTEVGSRVEQTFQLYRFPYISPWLLVMARKTAKTTLGDMNSPPLDE